MIPFASHPKAPASVSAAKDLLRPIRENPVRLGLAVAILLVIGMFVALSIIRYFLGILWG